MSKLALLYPKEIVYVPSSFAYQPSLKGASVLFPGAVGCRGQRPSDAPGTTTWASSTGGPIKPPQRSSARATPPTVFFPGHQRGVFTVTLPAVMRDTDVWWTLTTEYGDVTRVPGRIGSAAYELDWFLRPHGSLPPIVFFDSDPGVGRGPPGIMAERTQTVSVGSPLTLSVSATDPSERDLDDARNTEIPLRVVWSQLQGPGRVEYTRHESTPEEEEEDAAAAARRRRGRPEPRGPQVIPLSEGQGTASVIVTFSVPGEYIMRARVDNFSAPDSSDNDNCCFTNGYVRVNVTS